MTNWTGSDGNNSKTGGNGSDFFDGRGGDDTLHGAGGNDWLLGGLGADKLYGEDGDDTLGGGGADSPDLLSGDAGNDNIAGSATDTLLGGTGSDFVQLDVTMTSTAASVNLGRLLLGQTVTFADGTELSGFETGILYLGAGADFVRTGDGGFAVSGGGGSDTLLGGAADTWMEGGAGDDRLDGGAGTDWVAYSAASRGVRVSLATTTAQNTKGAGTDSLSGFENLQGSAFNDQLVGDAGDNRLFGAGGGGDDHLSSNCAYALMKGGSGNDVIGYDDFWYYSHTDYQTLIGGKGQDTLYVGSGDDAVFETLKDSTLARPDHVFMHGSPYGVKIDLHKIDADTTQAGDQAFTQITGKFTGEAAQLRVFLTTGPDGLAETWVLMDVDGDARADAMIVLEGDHKGFDDFVL